MPLELNATLSLDTRTKEMKLLNNLFPRLEIKYFTRCASEVEETNLPQINIRPF